MAAYAGAFTKVAQEFRSGNRIQFTRNNYRIDRLNGHAAEVRAIEAERSSMTHLADRHIWPGWMRAIHSSQGATCDQVDARSVYVAISRPSVVEALGLRDGSQVGAIDQPWWAIAR